MRHHPNPSTCISIQIYILQPTLIQPSKLGIVTMLRDSHLILRSHSRSTIRCSPVVLYNTAIQAQGQAFRVHPQGAAAVWGPLTTDTTSMKSSSPHTWELSFSLGYSGYMWAQLPLPWWGRGLPGWLATLLTFKLSPFFSLLLTPAFHTGLLPTQSCGIPRQGSSQGPAPSGAHPGTWPPSFCSFFFQAFNNSLNSRRLLIYSFVSLYNNFVEVFRSH